MLRFLHKYQSMKFLYLKCFFAEMEIKMLNIIFRNNVYLRSYASQFN